MAVSAILGLSRLPCSSIDDARLQRYVSIVSRIGVPMPNSLRFVPRNRLFVAILNDDVTFLESQVAARGDLVNATNEARTGDSLLHYAVWLGRERIFDMLVSKGATIDQRSQNRSTPLHYACFHGRTRLAEKLLKCGAQLISRMQGGDTPLHQAAWNGHHEIVRLLIDAASSRALHFVRAQKEGGECALSLASMRRHAKCVEIMLDAGASPCARNLAGHTPVSLATASGSLTCIKAFFAWADRQHDPASFIRDMASPEVLCAAASSGSLPLVRLLLKKGAPVMTISASDTAIRRSGAFRGAWSPVHFAAKKGHLEILKLILAHDPESYSRASSCTAASLSPLHLAALNGHSYVVAYLCSFSKDYVDAPARALDTDSTPLHFAVEANGQDAIASIRHLVNAGANVNAQCKDGTTPLMLACTNAYYSAATLVYLLEHGADVDMKRVCHATALHIAASEGNDAAVELLLTYGAKPSMENIGGIMAEEMAEQNGHGALARQIAAARTREERQAEH